MFERAAEAPPARASAEGGPDRVRERSRNATRRQALLRAIVGSYASVAVRWYARARFTILRRQRFLDEIEQYLPARGRVLDLGCGFGLFSLYFAGCAPERELHGVDVDAGRIEQAQASARRLGLANTQFTTGDLVGWRSEQRYDGVAGIDVIHHLPVAAVPEFLAGVRDALEPGGLLVLKDVADKPAYKRWFTLLLDRAMVGWEPLRYWPPDELATRLEELGFEVFVHRMNDILPYPHVLYVARLSG